MKYNQPFFVPYDKRHLVRGVDAFGYLPPLEQPQPEKEIPIREEIIITKRLDDNLVRIMGRRIFQLERLLAQHISSHSDKKFRRKIID